jgi:hypothetical protein
MEGIERMNKIEFHQDMFDAMSYRIKELEGQIYNAQGYLKHLKKNKEDAAKNGVVLQCIQCLDDTIKELDKALSPLASKEDIIK